MFRINILSLSLFLIFLFSYLAKAIHLKKQYKIQANVLAKGKRDKQTRRIEVVLKLAAFSWVVIWFLLSIAEPGISQRFHPFFKSEVLSGAGLFIIALGLGVFIAAMIEMKTSWRVGIDKNTKTTLVTEGIYRFSRNPAFLGFLHDYGCGTQASYKWSRYAGIWSLTYLREKFLLNAEGFSTMIREEAAIDSEVIRG